MKIQETKFYREIKLLGTDENDNIQLVDKYHYASKSRSFEKLLMDLLSNIYLYNDDLVIHRDKMKHFIKCTDFHSLEYAPKSNKLYEDEECYFHPELELFILISHNLSNEYDSEMFEEGLYKVNNVFYDNRKAEVKDHLKTLFAEYLEKYLPKKAKVSILLRTTHGFDLKTHTIKPFRIDFETMYNDDFQEIHQRVKQSITDENKGIVLFHGIAGSGKTNYIKWLTSQVPNKKFIFVPTTMISSLTDPSFINVLIDNKNSVLVLEDCENYIAERNAFNNNTDVVSSILNIADGMLSDVLECQLICTFNSDISKIDSALLRKGRLIAEYKFRELSVEKCNAYLQSLGKEMNITEPRSLAELTNMELKELKDKNEKKIGFR
ncbi:MAG: AAA family ATPase [Capnocytophaga sp.]|nr:AAA family ATPase [Capnocytophaga sp.]